MKATTIIGLLLAATASAMGADAPAGKPETTDFPPAKWTDAPAWLKAPEAGIEFMADPTHLARGFMIGDGKFAIVSFGWLAQQKDGRWRIMPEFYGRDVRPVKIDKDRLWATEGQSLMEINPADWSVVKRIKLSEDSWPVMIEKDGSWALEGRAHPPLVTAAFGHKALVRYSLEGKEKFRFVPKPAPGFDKPIGWAGVEIGPNPLITWTAFDSDAIWLLVDDVRGETPNDARIAGPSQIARLDIATGEAKYAVTRAQARSLVNDAGRLLWAKDAKKWTIEQLDKKTWAVSTAATLDVDYIYEVQKSGDYLWMRKLPDGLLALSLKDLKPVDAKDAGEPPAGLRPYDPKGLGHLMGSDPAGVWLAADRSRIARINDDGTANVRDFDKMLSPEFPAYYAATADRSLFVFWHGRLMRLTDGSDRLISLTLGDRRLTYLDKLFVGGRVWLRIRHDGLPTTTDLNLGDLRIVEPPSKDNPYLLPDMRTGLAAGDALFVWTPGGRNPEMWRLTPDGTVTQVESYARFIRDWFKKRIGREPTDGELVPYAHSPAVWDNGHIVISQRLSEDRIAVWSYDPKTDRWSDTIVETKAYPLGNPVVTSDGTGARLPKGFAFTYHTRGFLTTRFLYVGTPQGILRSERKAAEP